jgi:hypothetical protein
LWVLWRVKWGQSSISGDWIKRQMCGKVVPRSMSWSTSSSFMENICDRSCPCWLLWRQLRHFECNRKETLKIFKPILYLQLPYLYLSSLTDFRKLTNFPLNNGFLCLNLTWSE